MFSEVQKKIQIKNIIGKMFPKVWRSKTFKKCGDDFSKVILYDDHLDDTIIDGNTDLSGNIILESRDLVLSYLHIGIHTDYAKYRI